MVRGGLKCGIVLLLFSNLTYGGVISRKFPIHNKPNLCIETHQIEPRFFVIKLYDLNHPEGMIQVSTSHSRDGAFQMEESYMSWAYYHYVDESIAEETEESKDSDSEVVEIVSQSSSPVVAPKPHKRHRVEFDLDGSGI